jgi:hypothetical protein
VKFLKQFFNTNKKPNENWTMFSTSKKEVAELIVSTGETTIGDNFIIFENYPFEPSIAFRQTTFSSDQIDDVDYKSNPPTIKINEELIFLSAQKKGELEEFAIRNKLKTIERPKIWDWILEPFLDTEYTEETDNRLTDLLESYGLAGEMVKSLRAEVEIQMLKYNFDTMLWEWFSLDTLDVLRAMRTKYDKDTYKDFYKRVMKIALSPKTAE